MSGKIIGVAGATGSGKTTLVSQLCDRYNAVSIYEEWEDNPYLLDFYNSKNYFENQMWFIKKDIARMQRAIDLSSKRQMVIIDKIFLQNYTFVSITELKDSEKKLCFDFLDNYVHLSKHIDLIISISIAEEEILQRIKNRNRNIESGLNLEWFQKFQKFQKKYLLKYQEKFHFELIEYNNCQMTFENVVQQINNYTR